MQKNKAGGIFTALPALALLTSVLALPLVFVNFGKSENQVGAYFAFAALYLVSMGFPAVLYLVLRSESLPAKSYSAGFGTVPVILLGTVLLILQSSILKFGIFRADFDYSVYSAYGSGFDVSSVSFPLKLLAAVLLGAVPAVLEEVIFRGIVFRDCGRYGFFYAAVVSSALFAAVHFDLRGFFVYFAEGMLLCHLMLLTETFLPVVAVHLIYNVFAIFVEKYMWLFLSSRDTSVLAWLIAVSLYLIALFFYLGAGEKILRKKAEKNEPRIFGTEKIGAAKLAARTLGSEPMILEIILFIAVSVIFIAVGN